jgi:hypothetical protein
MIPFRTLALMLSCGLLLDACNCGKPPVVDRRKAEGEKCAKDDECETQFCDGVFNQPKVCLRTCAIGCKPLEVCTPLALDDRYACLPQKAGLCSTCATDEDCPYPADKCLTLGAEKFCGRDCGFDGTCPSSYKCAAGTTVSGMGVNKQCQPQSGTCTCTDATAGQTVPCESVNNEGRCVGVKRCEPPAGYAACNASIPAKEICNNKDDNCNGMTDENLGDIRCGMGECERVTGACVNGLPQTCTAGPPETERCDRKDNDCDGTIDNGFDTMTNVGHCGGCNNACVITNAVPKCAAGMCAIDHCLPGFSDRDGVAANGCEFACTPIDGGNGGAEVCDGIDNDCNGIIDDGFNLVSDPTNCGQCGLTCSVAGNTVSTYQCVARVCGIASCVTGKANCNQLYVDGCETDTTSNLANCGACGMTCAPANANGVCSNSSCGIGSCLTGFANCNNLTPDGCEKNLQTDAMNCGTCGRVCSGANAVSSCAAGNCQLMCNPGFFNADNNSANGCEYACTPTNNGIEACDNIDNDCDNLIDETFNKTNDLMNCGTCGNVCSAAFSSAVSCVASACQIVTCNAGRANCNNVYGDGCEVNTNTIANCGACGNVCNLANATNNCPSGTCGIQSCTAPWANCNNSAADGCEANTLNNINHCGGCNMACNLANAVPVCGSGMCQVAACIPGFVNLDGIASNGCELACTVSNGGVEICDNLDNNCNGQTDEGFNLSNNVNNCGACGNVCNAANVTSSTCSTGMCNVLTCGAGFGNCDNAFPNGCEVNTTNSTNNCGACGNVCSVANGTPQCQTSACRVASCNTGFANCDNVVANGCEINTTNNTNNCGMCGTVCAFANAAATCATSACAMGACNPGFVNLDGNPANGCEYSCTFTSSTDLPDLNFIDSNCDGIDGEVGNGIFVSTMGSDANPGTRAAPKLTINNALLGGLRDVYVSGGTYSAQVQMVSSKGVYGGYNSLTWGRSSSNVTIINGANPAVMFTSVNNATLQQFTVQGAAPVGAGNTGYGIMVTNGTGIKLEGLTLSAASGTNGLNGTNGTTTGVGLDGSQGQPGCEDSGGFCSSCARPVGGAPGNSSCGRIGGTGGAPGNGGSGGLAGLSGTGGTSGGPGTPPGQGNWTTPTLYWGADGANGSAGASGASGGNFGSLLASGYVGPLTGDGADAAHGNGGGGGGGGGGGCGGTKGTRGTSGGASFALYLFASSVTGTSNVFLTGNGGVGGNGGDGGAQGMRGLGGPQNAYGGGTEQDDGSNGGRGGNGGFGGKGGSGGGGGGGPSICVVRGSGSTFTSTTALSCVRGTPGVGGMSPGNSGGQSGLGQDLL